jgi:hypothetical protein
MLVSSLFKCCAVFLLLFVGEFIQKEQLSNVQHCTTGAMMVPTLHIEVKCCLLAAAHPAFLLLYFCYYYVVSKV